MASIGDRLEEARKRQGISIREAADATKIRSDFLLSFENNKFDFDLPDVYKRGFLKLYAKFLKLDADKMATDFSALMLAQGKGGGLRRGDGRESFGRMDIPENHPTIGSSKAEPPGEREERDRKRPTGQRRKEAGPADPVVSNRTGLSLYWKVGVGLVVTFAVIAGLILIFSNGGSDATTTEDTAANESADVPETFGPITIEATADTLNVLVREVANRKELYNGPMSAGQVVTREREGVVLIGTTQTENIIVKLEGQEPIRIGVSGMGKNFIGAAGIISRPTE